MVACPVVTLVVYNEAIFLVEEVVMLHPVVLCLYTSVTSDMRVYCFHRLAWASLSQVVAYLCPRLFCLTDWGESEGSVDSQGNVVLPALLPLTSEVMTQQAAYLLENGEQMLLWIGKFVKNHSIYI